MRDVEETMYDTVRNSLLVGIQTYKKNPRNNWILQHPG
jgi:hypothetical protein